MTTDSNSSSLIARFDPSLASQLIASYPLV